MTSLRPQFVDTNIFVHTLFGVDKSKQLRCIKLFQNAKDDQLKLWTTEWVIAELVWFLHKQKFSWIQTKTIITHILATPGLTVRGKNWLLSVIHFCRKNQDFIDAANITLALSVKINSGYSYDRDLDQWSPHFTRLEP